MGDIHEITKNKYLIRGCYSIEGDNKVKITELPVGSWTDDYKAFLEKLIDGKDGVISDYNDISTDKTVNITVTFAKKGYAKKMEIAEVEYGCNALEKYLKLYTTVSTTNMHLFDANEQLKKYDSVEEIIDDYFERRLEMYDIRKKNQLKQLKSELVLLSNKAKYINSILDGDIDLRRKKRNEIEGILNKNKFDKHGGDYNYLIRMPMDSVCEENVEKIMKQKGDKECQISTLNKQTIQEIWIQELNNIKQYI